MRAGLSGEIIRVLETKELIEFIARKGDINGVTVAAGGFIGKRSEEVVDSISNPARIIGIADAMGGIISEELGKYEEDIKKVRSGIAERMLIINIRGIIFNAQIRNNSRKNFISSFVNPFRSNKIAA